MQETVTYLTVEMYSLTPFLSPSLAILSWEQESLLLYVIY